MGGVIAKSAFDRGVEPRVLAEWRVLFAFAAFTLIVAAWRPRELRIRREDLLALGLSSAPSDLPARIEVDRTPPVPAETVMAQVPVALYNELLMKHERILVQYGMIRAGGQKLLEYKADAEVKADELRRAQERYQVLRARAVKEIGLLRRHLRQARIEIEDRNIEITLLHEKIKRLEVAAAGAASIETFDAQVAEIRQKARVIAQLSAADPGPPEPLPEPDTWARGVAPEGREEDH